MGQCQVAHTHRGEFPQCGEILVDHMAAFNPEKGGYLGLRCGSSYICSRRREKKCLRVGLNSLTYLFDLLQRSFDRA